MSVYAGDGASAGAVLLVASPSLPLDIDEELITQEIDPEGMRRESGTRDAGAGAGAVAGAGAGGAGVSASPPSPPRSSLTASARLSRVPWRS